MKRFLLLAAFTALAHAQQVAVPTGASLGESEAQKIEEKIASIRRDLLSKYETQLMELQAQLQKAADLEGSIAVRDERARIQAEQAISAANYVNDPKSLRALQQSTLGKMNEMVAGAVNESLPKLVDLKKQLTVEGRLDDALAVKRTIERLQNANVPIVRAEAGSIVPAETLLRAYSADRSRADKTYRGVRIAVRGTVAGYKLSPDDAKILHVYLVANGTSGWVQCSFNLSQWRYREDRTLTGTQLVLTSSKDNGEIRTMKGQQLDILGDCAGWNELVILTKCDVPR